MRCEIVILNQSNSKSFKISEFYVLQFLGELFNDTLSATLCLWFRASSYILWNNQQMQLYAVNFIPLLGSLYMFRVFYAPIIKTTIYNCIYSHWYKP